MSDLQSRMGVKRTASVLKQMGSYNRGPVHQLGHYNGPVKRLGHSQGVSVAKGGGVGGGGEIYPHC